MRDELAALPSPAYALAQLERLAARKRVENGVEDSK
jgi:hypothetical protein